MKRKVLGILLVVLMLGGCGSTSTDNAETVSQEAKSNDEAAAEEHVHDYIEEVEEATCEKDGVRTYTCECGDSYTEEIKATGHVFSEYLYNDDATFTEDGTETPSNGAQSNEAPAPAVSAGNEPCPYPLYTMFYDNQGFPYFYGSYGGSANMLPEHLAQTDAYMDQMEDYVQDNFPRESWEYGEEYFNSISWKSIGRYDNLQVVVRYYGHLHGTALAKPEERGIPTAGNGIWKK